MRNLLLLLLSLRPVNLVLALAILVSVRLGIFGGEAPQSPEQHASFLLYSLSVLFCMAWGYLINDFFDVMPDRINKPGKNIFDSPLRNVGLSFMIGCFLGGSMIPVGLWILQPDSPPGTIFLNLAALFLLWIYSRSLKSMVLWGNGLIALLAVLLMAAPLGFIPDWSSVTSESVFRWGIFTGFSFWVTFIRELVKDAEDAEGDAKTGVHTLATRAGLTSVLKAAAPQSLGVSVMLIFLFTFELSRQADFLRAFSYLILAIVGFISGTAIWVAKSKKPISKASLILKLWMGAGIICMWI